MRVGVTDYFGRPRLTPGRLFRRAVQVLDAAWKGAWFRVANMVGAKSVLGDANVAVSLTSHGARLRSVYVVLESIARGAVRPARLVLWVDPGVNDGELSQGLRRLRARGLEIRESSGLFGPHTKYFPYGAAALSDESAPSFLVTADDDVLYPQSWLSKLMSSDAGADDIVCYRAHKIALRDGEIAPYREWGRVTDVTPSYRNFATGVMGVRYPISFIRSVASRGPQFLESCPRADDIWLHVSALREGLRVRQLSDTAAEFPLLLGSQAHALVKQNAFNDGNDPQIAATYTRDDMRKLMLEKGSE